jgi:hypothetical protein
MAWISIPRSRVPMKPADVASLREGISKVELREIDDDMFIVVDGVTLRHISVSPSIVEAIDQINAAIERGWRVKIDEHGHFYSDGRVQ